MLGKLKFLWHHHRIPFLAFVAAIFVTALFVLRITIFSLYWAIPSHQYQPPERWMTPRYIAFSWGLDPADIASVLNVTTGFAKHPSLHQIAEARGVPVTQIIAEVNALLKSTPDIAK